MIVLSRGYMQQGKFDKRIRLCDETLAGLREISLKQHPLERKMKAQKWTFLR